MSVLSMSSACALLPKTVISRYSNTYTKKSKRLGIFLLPLGRLKMVIFTYSNILSSVSLINIDELACERAAEFGHLDCLKYLHETAKAPWNSGPYLSAHENNHLRMFTIPPRQQLSLTTRLVLQRRNFTHLIINTHTHTRKRDTQRERNTPFTLVKKETHSP